MKICNAGSCGLFKYNLGAPGGYCVKSGRHEAVTEGSDCKYEETYYVCEKCAHDCKSIGPIICGRFKEKPMTEYKITSEQIDELLRIANPLKPKFTDELFEIREKLAEWYSGHFSRKQEYCCDDFPILIRGNIVFIFSDKWSFREGYLHHVCFCPRCGKEPIKPTKS